MNMSDKHDVIEPAFTMEANDRFHHIIVSDPVLFELSRDTETVITFITIHRAAGTYSIVNVIKTYRNDRCISRSVQDKNGIPPGNIDMEMARIQTDFTRGIKAQCNGQIKCDILDLSTILDKTEQLQTIRKWGKLKIC